ncbi:MAG: hypothetical protein LH650_07020 [Chloroflexi bacterium]|nr:hypothetical protein [Chloroflexota bacterium]
MTTTDIRRCVHVHADGRACGAPRLKGGTRCYWHHLDKSADAAEASRRGGLRRKRERTVAAAYDLAGLNDVAAIRRVLEIALLDTLGLDNSVARSRVFIGGAAAAVKLLEVEREAGYGWDGGDGEG